MNDSETLAIVRRYYRAWARQDRAAVRAILADDLDFRSPQDRFTGADAFLVECWRYSEGLADVEFVEAIPSGDRAFVMLDWIMEDGGRFAGAETLRVEAGRIKRIIVVNNSPGFRDLIL
jgi:hypothetical protein